MKKIISLLLTIISLFTLCGPVLAYVSQTIEPEEINVASIINIEDQENIDSYNRSVSAGTASLTVYLKNSTGTTNLSGKIQLYFESGGYNEYNVGTSGLTLQGLTVGAKYGINAYVTNYATDTTFSIIPATATTYSKTFNMAQNSSFPTYSAPLSSYTSPGQDQHFGWRNNSGLDYHTGGDISKDANGNSFGGMTTKPTAKCVYGGEIYSKAFVSGAGNVVQIKQNTTTTYTTTFYVSYLHLMSYSCGNVGDAISTGSNIGVVGNTLYKANIGDPDMGVHLHISVSTSSSISKTSTSFKDPKAFSIY